MKNLLFASAPIIAWAIMKRVVLIGIICSCAEYAYTIILIQYLKMVIKIKKKYAKI
jgi:hypothetical protein